MKEFSCSSAAEICQIACEKGAQERIVIGCVLEVAKSMLPLLIETEAQPHKAALDSAEALFREEIEIDDCKDALYRAEKSQANWMVEYRRNDLKPLWRSQQCASLAIRLAVSEVIYRAICRASRRDPTYEPSAMNIWQVMDKACDAAKDRFVARTAREIVRKHITTEMWSRWGGLAYTKAERPDGWGREHLRSEGANNEAR